MNASKRLTGHERCAQMLSDAFDCQEKHVWLTELNGEVKETSYDPRTKSAGVIGNGEVGDGEQ